MFQDMREKISTMLVWGITVIFCLAFLKLSLCLEDIVSVSENFTDVYKLIKESQVEILLAQASLTFISISVMSILSENNIIIYWKNVVKDRLIKPVYSCFMSLTIYAFFLMAFSIISFFLETVVGVFLFFVLGMCVLCALTNAMIGVYYGREEEKKRLVKRFLKLEKDRKYEEREKCLDLLRAYTCLAYENNEYERLMENCEFYGSYASKHELLFLFEMLNEGNFTEYKIDILENILKGRSIYFNNQIKEQKKKQKKDEPSGISEEVISEINLMSEEGFQSIIYGLEKVNKVIEIRTSIIIISFIEELWRGILTTVSEFFSEKRQGLEFVDMKIKYKKSISNAYTDYDQLLSNDEFRRELCRCRNKNIKRLICLNSDDKWLGVMRGLAMLDVFFRGDTKNEFRGCFETLLVISLFQSGFLYEKCVEGIASIVIMDLARAVNHERYKEIEKEIEKKEILYGVKIGFRLSQLESVWERLDERLKEKEEIVKLLDKKLVDVLKDDSYQDFLESVLEYYKEESDMLQSVIIVGICAAHNIVKEGQKSTDEVKKLVGKIDENVIREPINLLNLINENEGLNEYEVAQKVFEYKNL